jgi:hypothetical protein
MQLHHPAERAHSAMRLHRLWTGTEMLPAHSLKHKLGRVFLFIFCPAFGAAKVCQSRNQPPDAAEKSASVVVMMETSLGGACMIVPESLNARQDRGGLEPICR